MFDPKYYDDIWVSSSLGGIHCGPWKDITLAPGDPDESDDGCIDDLIKGRRFAKWRDLL